MLKSRHFITYFGISFFCVTTMWWIWYLYLNNLPMHFPYNFLPPRGIAQLIVRSELWKFPFYASAGVAITTIIATIVQKHDKFYSELLISTTSFLSIIALASLVRVVFLFT